MPGHRVPRRAAAGGWAHWGGSVSRPVAVSRGGLARNTLSGGGLWLFLVAASSPMTVLAGGIVATYAATGVVGVPASFPLLGVALGLLLVGFLAACRRVPHAAPSYAVLTHGLGRPLGLVGAAVALISYNAIEISLFGLFGATATTLLGGVWWEWAAGAWLIAAVLGVLQVAVNTRVLVTVVVLELLVVGLFDLAAFTHPAGGHISLAPLTPSALWTPGVGGVFALGVAAFIGVETGPVFAEETPLRRTVARATLTGLACLAVCYTLTGWAMATVTGPDNVVDRARDPQSGLPFVVLDEVYGPGLGLLATLLLLTSVFAAMLTFHLVVARYLFALGWEHVLPAWLGRTSGGVRGGTPIGGSLTQTVVAGLVVAAFTTVGADPVKGLFTWLSTLAAVGVVALLTGTALAALFVLNRNGGSRDPLWVRIAAPVVAVPVGITVLTVTLENLGPLLGAQPGSRLPLLVPAILVVGGVIGLVWAVVLRVRRPHVYARIGRGRPHPLAMPEPRLADLDV
jgi:amino acid transporter